MLGDDRDRQLQRNQLLAIVLMTVLVFVWTYFFMPAAPPPAPPRQEDGTESTAEEERAGAGLFDRSDRTVAEENARTIPEGYPEIPPVASPPESPSDDELFLSNNQLELTFTRVGARLKAATVLLGSNGLDSMFCGSSMMTIGRVARR